MDDGENWESENGALGVAAIRGRVLVVITSAHATYISAHEARQLAAALCRIANECKEEGGS